MDKDLWLAKFGTTHVQANIAALENSNKLLIHIVFPHSGEQVPLSPIQIPKNSNIGLIVLSWCMGLFTIHLLINFLLTI